jgi:3-oxoacyl-[acyl-carrier-protein] synthase II
MLQRGEVEAVIAGGTESCISPVILAAFGRIQATSTRNDAPSAASRPFDAERDGFVPSEGAAVMLLESEAHAKARGAKIYAEVLGGSLTGDAFHVTAPRPDSEGAIRAMRQAVQWSGLSLNDVDVIYAHGTSTPLNDASETYAIKQVFGERANNIPVPAVKSMLGHSLGAAGALAALAAVQSFQAGVIPPTINYHTPDPECDLDYVPNQARQQKTNVALVNAFGFGGQNVVLVLGRYQGN